MTSIPTEVAREKEVVDQPWLQNLRTGWQPINTERYEERSQREDLAVALSHCLQFKSSARSRGVIRINLDSSELSDSRKLEIRLYLDRMKSDNVATLKKVKWLTKIVSKFLWLFIAIVYEASNRRRNKNLNVFVSAHLSRLHTPICKYYEKIFWWIGNVRNLKENI